MDNYLKIILDKLPRSSNDGFRMFLDEAMEGNEEVLPQLARQLITGDSVQPDLALAGEITDWCEVHGVCPSWLIEAPHVIDPTLSYKDKEIDRLIKLYNMGDNKALGVVVKAVQRDNALYDRFKYMLSHLLQSYTKIDTEYRLWQAVWVLDNRNDSDDKTKLEALDYIEQNLLPGHDPYIAIAFLEKVALVNQTRIWYYSTDDILNILEIRASRDVYTFYEGLMALVEARYKDAYDSFCEGNDRRCHLSKAYCLMNGIGTEKDVTSALKILKRYPDDSYALYLTAIGRYRMRCDQNVIPDEVPELLSEAERLGFGPAKSTLLMMRYRCQIANPDERGGNDGLFQGDLDAKTLEQDRDMLALFQLDCYRKASLSDDTGVDEGLEKAKMIKDPYSPMGYYALAFLADDADCLSNRYWNLAPACLNQSPMMRAWGVTKALTEYLFSEGSCDLEDLLILWKNMGASDRDIEDLQCVFRLQKYTRKPLIKVVAQAMVERLNQPGATDIEKLLTAFLCNKEYFQCEDMDTVEKLLIETTDVQDPLHKIIRNMLIDLNLLSSQITPSMEDEINPLSAEWIDEFIGHHFFHYSGNWIKGDLA